MGFFRFLKVTFDLMLYDNKEARTLLSDDEMKLVKKIDLVGKLIIVILFILSYIQNQYFPINYLTPYSYICIYILMIVGGTQCLCWILFRKFPLIELVDKLKAKI